MIRAALSTYMVDGLEAPPNFSVVLADDGGQPHLASGLNFLYRNHVAIVRSRRPSRVLSGLFAYLAGYLTPPSNGLLRVPGVGLVKNGRAVVAPTNITTWTDILAPRLNRNGVQFVDAPSVALDADRGELVVEETALVVDRTALAALGQQRAGSEPPAVEPGRYPLDGWALFVGDEEDMGPLSIANGIVAAGPGVIHHAGLKPERVIEALGRLFGSAQPVAVGSPYEGDLASKLVGVFSP